jgi:hypothetical protein
MPEGCRIARGNPCHRGLSAPDFASGVSFFLKSPIFFLKARSAGRQPHWIELSSFCWKRMRSLSLLSPQHVRDAYRRAWEQCRLEGADVPNVQAIQELVQAFKAAYGSGGRSSESNCRVDRNRYNPSSRGRI